MNKTLKKIKLSGKEYPYRCSNSVLAEIQEEYGTLAEFERQLSGRKPLLDKNGEQRTNEDGLKLYTKTEPSLKAVNYALPLMIEEGLQYEADKKRKEAPDVDPKFIIDEIDMNPFELAELLLEEFYGALAIKKETPSQKKTTKKTQS